MVAGIPARPADQMYRTRSGGHDLGAPTNSELSLAQLRCHEGTSTFWHRSGIADSAAVIGLGVSGDGEPDVAVRLL